MAVQTLDTVQRAFVNETIRQSLEDLVKAILKLDDFILDYDNQQNPILETADDLGDGVDGLAPRDDAPVLTGTLLATIRTNIGQMRATITTGELNALISLLVRSLREIRGG